jgi:hypothetical protein
LDSDHELVSQGTACNWGMKYASITGYGLLTDVENDPEKIEGYRNKWETQIIPKKNYV